MGDVHGCSDELGDLLDLVKFQSGDQLVFVGDLVMRGPDSKRVLEMARDFGALVARGNHDARVLEMRDAHMAKKHPAHAALAQQLDPRDWSFLATSRLWLDLPAHAVRVLHAGIDPRKPIQEQDEHTLLTVRYAKNDDGKKVLWGELYDGPPHVVFGHHAMGGLQMHAWCTGLDTGCVYGGTLTALVLDAGEPVPRATHEREGHLRRVSARRKYYEPDASKGS